MLNPRVKNYFIENFFFVILLICTLLTVLTTISVIGILGKESVKFFSQVPITDFLFGVKWEPLLEPKSFGVLPLVAGTLWVAFGSLLIALPLGLLVAIYLSEYSSEFKRSFLKPILEILAGIPTIVYGFFALVIVTPLLQKIYPSVQAFNAISGAFVVGIMILPMISSLCDDILRSLPHEMREGAYALGGLQYEVILQVLLPAVWGRVGAVVLLALSRAIGETMAVTLASGATPTLLVNPAESIQTMTAYIVQVSLGDTPAGGVEYLTCFAVGGLLFVMTLILNIIGHRVIISMDRKVQL